MESNWRKEWTYLRLRVSFILYINVLKYLI